MSLRRLALVALVAAYGCTAPTSALIQFGPAALETQAPDALRISVYDARHALVRDRRIDAPRWPGSILLQLTAQPGPLRIALVGLRGGQEVVRGWARLEGIPSNEMSGLTVELSSATPDLDGDGVPDAIDNCAAAPNPDQANAGALAGGDACSGGPAPVSFVGANSLAELACAAGPCAFSLPAPVGVMAGDVLFACAYVRKTGASSLLSPPDASWTSVQVPSPNGFSGAWFTKLAAAGEPTSYAFQSGTSTLASAALGAYRGVDLGMPIEAQDQSGTLTGNPFVAAGVSTIRPGAMLVACFLNDSGDAESFAPIAGMAKRADTGLVGLFDEVRASAGPTGARTALQAQQPLGTTASGGYVMIAFAPRR